MSQQEVFVDLGAGIGYETLNFIKECGNKLEKIICYECDIHNINLLKKNFGSYDNIIVRHNVVGENNSHRDLDKCDYLSEFTENCNQNGVIEMVSLDEDIYDRITFIKSDIRGGEQAAILGAKNHKKIDHPKLALSVYHRNEDIW